MMRRLVQQPFAADRIDASPRRAKRVARRRPPDRRAGRSGRLANGLAILLTAVVLPVIARVAPADGPAAVESPPPARAPVVAPRTGRRDAYRKDRQPPRYERRARHDPNGIGKFYMGREIAHVMGAGGIDWLERPERESEERLTRLVELLEIKPGMTVADIGAGSGVISVKLAAKVGPSGRVMAVDIQDEMLSVLAKKLKQLKIVNVKPVHGSEKSPNLKSQAVDVALMVDVYHEFRFPYEMLASLAKTLKPGGRIVFVEYRMEDPTVLIKLVHKMSEAQVKKEAALPEFGLRWVETKSDLPRQHVIIFERKAAEETKSPSTFRGG